MFGEPIDFVAMMASKGEIFLSVERRRKEYSRVLAYFAPISSLL